MTIIDKTNKSNHTTSLERYLVSSKDYTVCDEGVITFKFCKFMIGKINKNSI